LLSVTAKGYRSMSQRMPMPDRPTNRLEFPTIVLPLANQKLGGQFLDSKGKPVAGASVQAFALTYQNKPSADKLDTWDMVTVPGRFQGSAQTDSEGRFFIDEVCEGLIQLNCFFQGYPFSAQTLGGTTNIVLRLDLSGVKVLNNNVPRPAADPGVTITGTVRDPSGAPAAGLWLRLWGNALNQPEAKTDSHGRYSLALMKQLNAPQFVIVARDLAHNLAASHEIDDTATNLDLTLQPGLTLSVKAQDVNGNPIPSAWGTLALMNWNLSTTPVMADDQGVIQITALPQGRPYSATITARGYSVAKVNATAEQTQTNRLDFPIIVLRLADRQLAGQVLGADGKPVPSARVSLDMNTQSDGQPFVAANTDAQGRFSFDAVTEGTFQLNALGSHNFGTAQAQGGDTNVVVQLAVGPRAANARVVTTSGTVFDPSGAPAHGVLLWLASTSDGAPDAKTDADGKFKISWRPYPYSAMDQLFAGRDLERNFAGTINISETTTNVDMRLQRALTLSGSVQDNNGAALKTAGVRLWLNRNNAHTMSPPSIWQGAAVDENGGFTFSVLPSGQSYKLSAMAAGFGSQSATIGADQTQTASLQLPPIKLQPADRPLEGQVVGSDGNPVPGATVQINEPGQPTASTKSDANGHFALKVCEGKVRLFADGSPNVLAQAGDTNVIVKVARQAAVTAAVPARNGQAPTNRPPTSTSSSP
jgi:protocatechuate 3,4-dioxygenase beta subunit